MRRLGLIRRLARDRRGNIGLVLAGSLMLAGGAAAIGVDTATLYLSKRRVQGIADAAAFAAAGNFPHADREARRAISANGDEAVTLAALVTGRFDADPAVPIEGRFAASIGDSNAVRVVLRYDSPLFFARLFGARSVTVEASSTAAAINLAAFSIGSRLVGVSGGLPNALLSQLAGVELALSVMDYQSLVSADIDVMRFAHSLRARVGGGAITLGDTLASSATLPQVVNALADASGGPAAGVLRTLAARLPATGVIPARIIDLGPLAREVSIDPSQPVMVDAASILRAFLELGGTREASVDVDLAAPGIASSRLMLIIGERAADSPWLSVGEMGDVVVRTSQARMYLDVRLLSAPAVGLTALRVPLYAELAAAEARLVDVDCASGRSQVNAALDVTVSPGRIAIADVDTRAFQDIARPVVLRPAVLSTSPLLTISCFSDINLSGRHAQRVVFSAQEISERSPRTIASQDIGSGVASSLISRVDISVRVLGLGLDTRLLSATVGAVLRQAAPAIDGLFGQVRALSGVRVGEADVWINAARCGSPALIG